MPDEFGLCKSTSEQCGFWKASLEQLLCMLTLINGTLYDFRGVQIPRLLEPQYLMLNWSVTFELLQLKVTLGKSIFQKKESIALLQLYIYTWTCLKHGKDVPMMVESMSDAFIWRISQCDVLYIMKLHVDSILRLFPMLNIQPVKAMIISWRVQADMQCSAMQCSRLPILHPDTLFLGKLSLILGHNYVFTVA